ncbi:MAG: hypothetical protein QOG04_1496 [Actinomycetota bacterium]|jgi:uncharacterized RDD family membrane protein YckC|nr:hypothetical protein [Actinomycetota bacterium]
MNKNYLKEFERWTAGPAASREAASAEFAEHLREAEAAGELGSTLERLGPPRDAAKAFAAGRELTPATWPRRIGAFLLDCAIPMTLVAVIVVLGTLFGTNHEFHRLEELGRNLSNEMSINWGFLEVGALLLIVLAALWYFVGLTVMEWRYGRTPGKALTSLRVVSEDGIALSFGQAVVRRLTLVFSGPLQIVDWAFAFFNPQRQRAVERLARTRVIRDETPEPRSTVAVRAPATDGAR